MPEGANLAVDFEHEQIERLFEELDVEATISYSAEYAAYVEFPTEYKGTQPPFQPLYEWVKRKWNDLDDKLKSAADPDDELPKTEHQKRVAWIVVKSIADDGTDGVFYMRRSFEAAKQAGEQFLEQFEESNDIEAPRKVFERTFDFAFEQSQKIVAEEASDRGTLLQSGQVAVTRSGDTVFEEEGGNE